MSSVRLPAIDGLRGVAFLAVLYHHLFAVFTPPGFRSFTAGGHLVLPFAPFSNGWLGVNLFFVLSGFVLFAPYASGRRTMFTPTDVVAFYTRRAHRLLPLYFVCSLLCFALLTPAASRQWTTLAMLVTVTFNFTKDFFPPYNWVLWSLGVEIWMSLAFPLLVVIARRAGIWALLVGAEVVALATRIAGNRPDLHPPLSPVLNFVKDSFVGRIDDFVVGMVMVVVYLRLRETSERRTLPMALAVVVGALAMYASAACWDAVRLDRVDRTVVPFTNNMFQVGCVLLGTSVLLARGPGARIIANPVLQLLGMMCYSLYVWHGVTMLPIIGGEHSSANVTIYLVVLAGLSALSYRYIEFGNVRDPRTLFRTAAVDR